MSQTSFTLVVVRIKQGHDQFPGYVPWLSFLSGWGDQLIGLVRCGLNGANPTSLKSCEPFDEKLDRDLAIAKGTTLKLNSFSIQNPLLQVAAVDCNKDIVE